MVTLTETMRGLINKLTESTSIPEEALEKVAQQTAAALHTAFPERFDRPLGEVVFSDSASFFRGFIIHVNFEDKRDYAAFKSENPEFVKLMKDGNTAAKNIHPGAQIKIVSLIYQEGTRGDENTYRYELVIAVDKRKDPAFAEEIKFFKETVPNAIRELSAKLSPQFDTKNIGGLELGLHSISKKNDTYAYRMHRPEAFQNRFAAKWKEMEAAGARDDDYWTLARSFDVGGAVNAIETEIRKMFDGMEIGGKTVKVSTASNRPGKILLTVYTPRQMRS
jgi:hypothetical protein